MCGYFCEFLRLENYDCVGGVGTAVSLNCRAKCSFVLCRLLSLEMQFCAVYTV